MENLSSVSTGDIKYPGSLQDYQNSKENGNHKSSQKFVNGINIPEPSFETFMRDYVELLFRGSSFVTLELKSRFGEAARTAAGRRSFCQLVTSHRGESKVVNEDVLLNLVGHFSIILLEAQLSEDFTTGRVVMNLSFTFYSEEKSGKQQYPYMYLKDQPIFQDTRFWNAAFFDSLQNLRNAKPVLQNGHENGFDDESLESERSFQANITFGQIGNFLCNMQALGLPEDFCRAFLEKQCVIGNLPVEQTRMLNDYFARLFNH